MGKIHDKVICIKKIMCLAYGEIRDTNDVERKARTFRSRPTFLYFIRDELKGRIQTKVVASVNS